MRRLLLTCLLSVFLTAALAGLPGRALGFTDQTTGRPISQAKVDKIVMEKTTLKEIIALFGAPTSSSVMGKTTLYTYMYTRISGFNFGIAGLGTNNGEEQSDELTITFNEEGIVEVFNITQGLEPEPKKS